MKQVTKGRKKRVLYANLKNKTQQPWDKGGMIKERKRVTMEAERLSEDFTGH